MKRSRLVLFILATSGVVFPAHADAPPQQYTVSAYLVRDNATQLTWQRETDEMKRPWSAAVSYCGQLQVAGGGWRLPTLKELLTLVDPARTTAPAIDLNTFPSAKGDLYWSSNSWATDNTHAWSVDFLNGNSAKDHVKSDPAYVRCVR